MLICFRKYVVQQKRGCCFPINKPCFNLKKPDLDLWQKQRFANICPPKTKRTKLQTCQVIGVTTWMLEYKSIKKLGFCILGAANGKKWDLIFLDVSSRNPAKHSRFLKRIVIPMSRIIKRFQNTGFLYIHMNYKQQKRSKRAFSFPPAGTFKPIASILGGVGKKKIHHFFEVVFFFGYFPLVLGSEEGIPLGATSRRKWWLCLLKKGSG